MTTDGETACSSTLDQRSVRHFESLSMSMISAPDGWAQWVNEDFILFWDVIVLSFQDAIT